MLHIHGKVILQMRWLLLYLLLLGFRSYGQEFSFNHLTSKDGLGSNFVNCIWQDKKGFLWVGTDNGLQRYDGYNFLSTRKFRQSALPAKPVHQIAGDNKGRMFIRMNNTIGIFDGTTFRYEPVPVIYDNPTLESRDWFLEMDAHGNVYVMIDRYAWYFFNEQTRAFEESAAPFKIPHEWGLSKIYDDTVTNRYWVASDHGIAYFDRSDKKLYHKDNNPKNLPLLNDERITNLVEFFIDSKRRYWIVSWNTEQRFFCFDENKQQFIADTSGYSELAKNGYYELKHVTEVGNNKLVVGYGNNALIYNHDNSFMVEPSDYDNTYSLHFRIIHQVYQDREKIVWLATDNGLYNTMANLHSSRHMILAKTVTAPINSLFEAGNGDIVVGTWGKYLLSRSPNLEQQGSFPKMNIDDKRFAMIWDFCTESSTGNTWIGCQEGRLAIYETAKKKYRYLTPEPFGKRTIRVIKEDRFGNLWFGTQNGRIIKWKAGSTFSDSSFKEIYNFTNRISDLYFDRKGLLWVVSDGRGMVTIDPLTDKATDPFFKNDSRIPLYSNYVISIREVNDSITAIAGDALNLFNTRTKKMLYITQWNGEPIGMMTSMQVDNAGQIWFSSTNGIYKYNIRRKHLSKYTQWDGLITISNKDYELDRSIKLKNGHLVFGGSKNLVLFDPAKYSKEVMPPPVAITGFRLWDEFLPVDSLAALNRIELTRTQNSLNISFASLSFSQINKLNYYYKLVGADKHWIKADASLQANYNLLPPGHYEFMVESQNEEGVFSPTTKLKIYIRPPFYLTWWFILLASTATAALIYAVHRFRINELIKVENVRKRLARDLHDDMGSTLSTINILSAVSLKKIDKDNDSVKDNLSKISSSSTRIMEAMDDIVWSINPNNDSMNKIISRMKELAGDLLDAKDISYNFIIEDAGRELSFDMESRRQIFLIFKEALNNAMKYSQCTKVEISIRVKKKKFVLYIADNGIGFDQLSETGKAGNGLKNMHKRAEDAGGTLMIVSARGEGTTVTLELPVM